MREPESHRGASCGNQEEEEKTKKAMKNRVFMGKRPDLAEDLALVAEPGSAESQSWRYRCFDGEMVFRGPGSGPKEGGHGCEPQAKTAENKSKKHKKDKAEAWRENLRLADKDAYDEYMKKVAKDQARQAAVSAERQKTWQETTDLLKEGQGSSSTG